VNSAAIQANSSRCLRGVKKHDMIQCCQISNQERYKSRETQLSESGSGATHIVRVEKPQPADETTRIEATPATGAEIRNHDTEDARVGEPTDAHAVVFPAAGKPAMMPCPEPRRRQ
jgi:hypothetical protein